MYRMARTATESGRLIPNLVQIWRHLKGFHGHPRLNFNVCMKIVFGLVVWNITAISRGAFPGSPSGAPDRVLHSAVRIRGKDLVYFVWEWRNPVYFSISLS